MGVAVTLYQQYILTASTDDLDVLRPEWWTRTSGIPLATITGWIADRRKDLHDQEVLRKREEVVE